METCVFCSHQDEPFSGNLQWRNGFYPIHRCDDCGTKLCKRCLDEWGQMNVQHDGAVGECPNCGIYPESELDPLKCLSKTLQITELGQAPIHAKVHSIKSEIRLSREQPLEDRAYYRKYTLKIRGKKFKTTIMYIYKDQQWMWKNPEWKKCEIAILN